MNFFIKCGKIIPEFTRNTTRVAFSMKPVYCSTLTWDIYFNDVSQNWNRDC